MKSYENDEVEYKSERPGDDIALNDAFVFGIDGVNKGHPKDSETEDRDDRGYHRVDRIAVCLNDCAKSSHNCGYPITDEKVRGSFHSEGDRLDLAGNIDREYGLTEKINKVSEDESYGKAYQGIKENGSVKALAVVRSVILADEYESSGRECRIDGANEAFNVTRNGISRNTSRAESIDSRLDLKI